jgi:hypothetical protein
MKAILLFIGLSLFVQSNVVNFIGMSKDDVMSEMKKSNSSFDLDEGAKNSLHKYLKYVDKYNEETWLFFLSENDVCTKSKLISDYSNLKDRTDKLNKMYKKAGENKWIYVKKDVAYVVELKKEEWFFTIITKQK